MSENGVLSSFDGFRCVEIQGPETQLAEEIG
jgi:hypothetical protein